VTGWGQSRFRFTLRAAIVTIIVAAACSRPAPPTPTPGVIDSPTPTLPVYVTAAPDPTAAPTCTATPSPVPPASPPRTPTAVPRFDPQPVEGYWIQTTTRDGLCSNAPRFVGYDRTNYRAYIAGSGGRACFFDWADLSEWRADGPSLARGFPSWVSFTVPRLSAINAGTDYRAHDGGYGLPSFAGRGGLCYLPVAGHSDELDWQCFSVADGLPFNDVRAYHRDDGIEWFMSSNTVVGRGMEPEDLVYSIPELVGARWAQGTAMHVPRADEPVAWVGTDGYGLLEIRPSSGEVTHHTSADGMPDDAIADIVSHDGIWVATERGIGYWDGRRWQAHTMEDGLPSDVVLGISPARLDHPAGGAQAGMWAATSAGPALLIDGASSWQSFPEFPSGARVTGVMENAFSTRRQGLIRFMQAPVVTGEIEALTTREGLPTNRIVALAESPDGVVVGTPYGAVEWDGQEVARITSSGVNDVTGTSVAANNGLWVLRGDSWERAVAERVTQVEEGNWYATGGQVSKLIGEVPSALTDADGEDLVGVRLLAASPEDGILVTVDDDSVDVYTTRTCSPACPVESYDLVAAGSEDVCGEINAASFAAGWLKFATDLGICAPLDGPLGVPLEADGMLSAYWPVEVRQVAYEPATGMVWVATNQGVFRAPAYEEGRSGRWAPIGGIPSSNVTAVLPLADGSAWIGTADSGLFHFTPEEDG
jgi:hypothetical protein